MACPFCYSTDGPCNNQRDPQSSPVFRIVVPPEFSKCLVSCYRSCVSIMPLQRDLVCTLTFKLINVIVWLTHNISFLSAFFNDIFFLLLFLRSHICCLLQLTNVTFKLIFSPFSFISSMYSASNATISMNTSSLMKITIHVYSPTG